MQGLVNIIESSKIYPQKKEAIMMTTKSYPIGIQTFERIIRDGYLYIDVSHYPDRPE